MARLLVVMGVFLTLIAILFYTSPSLKPWSPIEIETEAFSQVILYPDEEAKDVQLALVYPNGEMANPYDEGLAHYLEHLVALRFLENFKTETFRHGNAWTNSYATAYFGSSKKERLTPFLQKLAETAAPLETDPVFAAEERDIVMREYEQGNAHTKTAQLYVGLVVDLLEDAPLSRSVIGTPEAINSYDLNVAKRLHARSHRLADATLLVHGNLGKRELEKVLSAVSYSQPSTLKPLPTPKGLPVTTERLTAAKTVSEISTDLVWRKLVRVSGCENPVVCNAKITTLERVLDSAARGGIAGPLRYDAFYARNFRFDIFNPETGVIEIQFSAVADKGVSHKDLLAEFERVLQDKLTSTIPTSTYDRIRTRLLDDWDTDDPDPEEEFDMAIGWLGDGLQPVTGRERKSAFESLTKEELEKFSGELAAPGRVVIRFVY
ncbi:insulinase family protein [Cognatishimia activa]|uniref:Protease3 n=1 Tax=Cognatishimia activa TaxID=1715691 RepID=A0A0N7MB30_9RHOB|nr:insulinase family protein [Cognatishimia activa]CUI28111.1 protease3 [Cognatishimia activa]CUK24264.1 protease3 [Cognatishimia activa]